MYRIALLFILIASSCSLFDTRSYEPAFVTIDQVTLETSPEQGIATEKIKDIWMYANDTLLGVFPIPARIPVLVNSPETRLTAFAGIRNDGLNDLPFIYQLIERQEESVKLNPGDTYNMDLKFSYGSKTKFAFVEDFENGHRFNFEGDDDEKTKLIAATDGAKYGSMTGLISLDTAHHTITVGYDTAIPAKDLGRSDAYLEMDYKNDVPFAVSVALVDKGTVKINNKIYLKESEEWNKIYIDLTQVINSSTLESYRILFSSTIKGTKYNKGTIYMDNIKMLHL